MFLQEFSIDLYAQTRAVGHDDVPGLVTHALFDVYPEWRELEAVPIELKAGSASIHNGMIAHGAGPNVTPKPRRAMVCIYMPDGMKFNGIQNILSSEQMTELEVGDSLNDNDQHPVVWSKLS